jgi:hypothetical protein
LFLSFLQQYYATDKKYTWVKAPDKTKIIIADKFATELGVAAKRPSIFLDRGPISLTQMIRNEAMPLSKASGHPGSLFDKSQESYSLTDLISCSVNLIVVGKNPIEVDFIANQALTAIIVFREKFKEKGIHKFTGYSLSKEAMAKIGPAGAELTTSTISVSFLMQWDFKLSERNYNCSIFDGEHELLEGIDFVVEPDGAQIKLKFVPAQPLSLKINYVDSTTLEENLNKNLISVIGDTTLYVVPDNGSIYGYYTLLQNIDITQE